MKKRFLSLGCIAVFLVFIITNCQSGTKERSEEKVSGDKPSVSINYNEDLGGQPWVLDIEEATLGNENYRSANWTGKYLQLVFMTLKPGEVIDLEVHDGHDQFIRIEKGEARVLMGKTRETLNFDKNVSDDWSILIPAGYWHKVENTGKTDLKLYTLYGPPEHRKGTMNKTYDEAKAAHYDHDNTAAETEAIKTVIDHSYIDGIHNLKGSEVIRQGFIADFEMLMLVDNQMIKMPLERWIANVEKQRAESGGSPAHPTSARYLEIDITGSAAVVKLELYREEKKLFTDYLALYKFSEGWKIVSKTFYRY